MEKGKEFDDAHVEGVVLEEGAVVANFTRSKRFVKFVNGENDAYDALKAMCNVFDGLIDLEKRIIANDESAPRKFKCSKPMEEMSFVLEAATGKTPSYGQAILAVWAASAYILPKLVASRKLRVEYTKMFRYGGSTMVDSRVAANHKVSYR